MEKDELNILNTIAQTLFDKKGMNILVLDVKKISSLTDFVIIVEGNVDRHVIALAQAVYGAMKDLGHHPCHEQGIKTGDWVVLDYFQVMIHIFIPSIRDKYHLEELWREGEIVDVDIDLSHSMSGGYIGSASSVSF